MNPFDNGVRFSYRCAYWRQTPPEGERSLFRTTSTGADRERLASELIATRLGAARLRALSAGGGSIDPKDIPVDADASAVELQQRILRDQVREQKARLSSIEGTVQQRKAEHATTLEIIKKLEATLPLVTQRTEAVKALTEQKLAPQQSYLELEQQRIEQQQDLAAQRNHLQTVSSAIAEAEQGWQAQQAEFRRTVLSDLSDAMDRIAFLTQELVKAEQRNSAQRLVSPVSGIVQQLAIHTVGGIVTPAQQLMIVVPEEHQLEVEAAVLNQDIGFVRNGQQAEIKVETFPFTKYGTIEAEIVDVSDDAVPDETRGLVYTARVLMRKSVMQVEDRFVNLAPGMSVTVEIKTGKRRLIEYFLSPLLQYSKESVRER